MASDAALGQTDFDGSFLITHRVWAGYATPRRDVETDAAVPSVGLTRRF